MTSPSLHASPTPSVHVPELTTLEKLITHFVAAKRSLSATSHVYRANEIVYTARKLIEETAVLSARNAYLERGASEEANALSAVRDGLDSVFKGGNEEFKAQVKALDDAHNSLQSTLQRLRDTIVDSSLASRQPHLYDDDIQSPSSSAQDAPRTLHDFISEQGHNTLLQSLRQDIDSYNAAQNIFQDSQIAFDQSLTILAKTLRQVDAASVRSRHSPSEDDDADPSTSIPDLFHNLTTHATEAASLLQSLISHYDVCSTALKHTEGGGEAARAAAESSTGQGMEGMDQSLYEGNHAREPITADERDEMLHVIENDAQEVDDVVLEIRESLSIMEDHLAHISDHAKSARTCHTHLATVLRLLRKIGGELPAHISSLNTYTASWAHIKEDLQHKLSEMKGLDSIYDGFLRSYALLLKEVARRAAAEAKMKKVLDKAKREVDAMCETELHLRNEFLGDVSDYLPRDIWPALVDAPVTWEFTAIAQGTLGEAMMPEHHAEGHHDED